VTLQPKQQLPIDLHFAPSYHMAPFKLPLLVQSGLGPDTNLLSVSGRCHTAELRLSEHSLLFGDVVFHSTGVRRVKLHNFGDLGVKFRFDLPPGVAGRFSVDPPDGFAAPHDDVDLLVKFHPTPQNSGKEERGGQKKIRCLLEPSYQQEPVELIVQGHGIEQPEGAVKKLDFTAEVREKKVIEFTFPPDGKNPSSEPWTINPVMKTEVPSSVNYFSCPSEIVVPPGGQTTIEIVYRPLTMTLPEEERLATESSEEPGDGKGRTAKRRRLPEKHIGKAFIATPDGKAVVLDLEGTALPSKDVRRISSEVHCKTQHAQSVDISNWLQESQRFDVKLTLVEPSDAGGEIKLHGVSTFDLPAGMKKDYKFNVYAYREGKALASLLFTNVKTQEFMAVEVAFTFVPPATLGLIKLATACRQNAHHAITVQNPLQSPATFKCEASHPDIRFSPASLTLPPNAEASVDVIFRPCLAGKGEGTVSLVSPELGAYPYTLEYDAKPAGLEKTMVFKAPLGSGDTVQAFRFVHYSKKPGAYDARIEAAPGHKGPTGDFVVETKDIKAAAAGDDEGVHMSVDVRFQPSLLGEIRALLVLSSPDGGDYKALLMGYTQPPQPQGPVAIQAGKGGTVEFSNPFDDVVEFTVQIDNPSFTVTNRSFKLDPKKSCPLAVQFKSDKPEGGRLIITALKIPNPWIFFLKGAL